MSIAKSLEVRIREYEKFLNQRPKSLPVSNWEIDLLRLELDHLLKFEQAETVNPPETPLFMGVNLIEVKS